MEIKTKKELKVLSVCFFSDIAYINKLRFKTLKQNNQRRLKYRFKVIWINFMKNKQIKTQNLHVFKVTGVTFLITM